MGTKIKVCNGHACKSKNSKYAFQRACNALKLPEDKGGEAGNGVSVEHMGCSGHCQEGPFVIIERDGKTIENRYIDASKMGDIMNVYKNKNMNKDKQKEKGIVRAEKKDIKKYEKVVGDDL